MQIYFVFLLFLLKSILCISATMTKTKINCFHISGVVSQPHRNTHRHTHRVSSYYTRFCARYTVYQIKMNLHGSKWDRPNWQWGFNAVPTAYSMQGLLSWNQTSPHSKGCIRRRNVKDKEPCSVLLAAYTQESGLCVWICAYTNANGECVLMPCVCSQPSTWLSVFIITAYRRCWWGLQENRDSICIWH